jgi:hypothetical protein
MSVLITAIVSAVPPDAANPFAVLSLIVAPALLTNASSLLAMSTSNRLARAVDRARELSKQLEKAADLGSRESTRRLSELAAAENRAILLVASLQRFYIAMGSFAFGTLISLIGAVLVTLEVDAFLRATEIIAVAAGMLAVGALVHGSMMLVRETRIALAVIRTRAARIQERAASDPEAVSNEQSGSG